ncbi:MAG: hypothetical protein GF368_00475 [Candidatus Aenigmarchaeota archaeon]|nr:hypothetical protein [Candidatus Aenigmarchaeota archaeon]
MIKAQMSLEYIVKITILLVVVIVITGMIINFYDQIKAKIKELFGRKEPEVDFPKIIDKTSFTAGEVSAYIESCHSTMSSLPEEVQDNIICYLLRSDTIITIDTGLATPGGITVTWNWVSGTFDEMKIEYQDVGNEIVISD